jgi:hypothetical protein
MYILPIALVLSNAEFPLAHVAVVFRCMLVCCKTRFPVTQVRHRLLDR